MDLEELAMMLDTLDVDNVTESDFLKTSEKAKMIDFEDDQKLVLYGLYKQAIIGNVNCGKPSFLDIVGTAKWNAWKGFSGFPKKSAMGAYIYLVEQWLEEVGKGDGIKRVLRLGADGNPTFDKVGSTVSTLIGDNGETPAWQESEKIFEAVVQNDIIQLQKCVDEGIDINAKSSEGLAPIHYASDRGHLEILKYLIDSKADINIKDEDGQTAYDYAELCDHHEVLNYLKEKLDTKS